MLFAKSEIEILTCVLGLRASVSVVPSHCLRSQSTSIGSNRDLQRLTLTPGANETFNSEQQGRRLRVPDVILDGVVQRFDGFEKLF